MSLDTFVRLATSILGLAGLAGLATAGLLSARRRELDRINAQERTDLRARVDTQGEEIARLVAREHDCQAQLTLQQEQIDALKELVTQAAAVAELRATTAQHHEEVVARLDGLQSASMVLLSRTGTDG